MYTEKRTYADRAAYMVQAVKKRRIRLRVMARDYKGGKCELCGYKKCPRALSFHHIDPKKKAFGISTKGLTRSWDKIREEIDKCVLLCANCHMEVHDGITQLPKRNLGRKRGEFGEAVQVIPSRALIVKKSKKV
jgi:HNH endonuclease.